MRLVFSLSVFAVTMILALFAFTFTTIYFPTTMRDLLAGADQVRRQVSYLSFPDRYMVWVDLLLQPNQIVLVGFAIAIRFLTAMISSVFGAGNASANSTSNSKDLPFSRWG